MMGDGWGLDGFGTVLPGLFWLALVTLAAVAALAALTALVTLAATPARSSKPPRAGRDDPRRTALLVVALLALLGLVAAAAWTVSGPRGIGAWMDHRSGADGSWTDDETSRGWHGDVIDGVHGLAGSGPVTTLDQARAAAQRYGDRLDLEVGEVMQFDNGFYAALHEDDGSGATEVLVDADDGDVRVEYGPAMMWNTTYGMHAADAARAAEVTPGEARALAAAWLSERDDDLDVGEVEQFPGYYTLHTEHEGRVTGMLSVNAYTGSVWFHSWHGSFVALTGH